MADEQKSGGDLLSKMFSWLPSRHEGQSSGEQANKPVINALKLVFFIVDWGRGKALSDVFEKHNAAFHFISRGRGTASSEILDLLGIGRSDKAVIIGLERPREITALFAEVQKKLDFHTPGAGIAFSVPLSGINSPVLRAFAHNANRDEKKSGAAEKRWSGPDRRRQGGHHALIVSIINSGYSDDFMNTAREAGARGGTIINARGQANEGTVKFFGISVQSEQEVILILSTEEKKGPIMEALGKAYGCGTKAKGLIVSLPAEAISVPE